MNVVITKIEQVSPVKEKAFLLQTPKSFDQVLVHIFWK